MTRDGESCACVIITTQKSHVPPMLPMLEVGPAVQNVEWPVCLALPNGRPPQNVCADVDWRTGDARDPSVARDILKEGGFTAVSGTDHQEQPCHSKSFHKRPVETLQ